MKKVAVIIANGCEEVEALTPIDVFRRMGQKADMVGLGSQNITGAHDIALHCDDVVSDRLLDYDCVIFPGGMGGAHALRDSDQLMTIMKKRQAANKWNAAMCAAPIAFARYGLLDGHDYTCFPGIDKETKEVAPSGHFKEDITVVDDAGHIITSRGPATALAYAFRIAETLGLDTTEIKQQMLYDFLKAHIND